MSWMWVRRALVASVALAIAATTMVGTAQAGEEKIRPKLRQQLAAEERGDFWVRFADRADLSAATRTSDWNARGTLVARALRETAAQSQTAVRKRLDGAGVRYDAYWATNAIFVRDGSERLAADLAARPEVDALYAPVAYELPEPIPGKQVREVESVEWGIANIRANDVWQQYGVTGDGMTVASIDSGVQYDHPALVRQYRGNLGNGAFDHDYNWFDAAGLCADAPCDDHGHGTHTMGTMVGDDGAGNQIGVAPGVRWIAANGCCPSDDALIASGQWMLEPTDLTGQLPDASKRPNIINNSWGTTVPSDDPFMEDVSAAWVASGIFAVWANGNNAPGCRTTASPGSRTVNYSAGAYDENNAIASFSSRGFGQDGEIKPNLSAPGVNVRSSYPGGGYVSMDGTSMATPHVAGAIALLWSAAPELVGDVAGTRALLDGTAVDTPSDECDGTPADNNVFGEGRLDALVLLDAANVAETGTFAASVTSGDAPLGGARVRVVGPVTRERVTGADGRYALPLPAGDYTVTVSAFGHATQVAPVRVVVGQTVSRSFALAASPTVKVSGRITDGSGQGWPLHATVSVPGTPVKPILTDPADGRYSLTVPAGATYTLRVSSEYGGYRAVAEEVVVGSRNLTRDIRVPVDETACDAPGYHVAYDGIGAEFDGGALPAGWAVTDAAGTGQVWRFDDPGRRSNRTGGNGGFAILDSFYYWLGGHQDSTLVSPAADLSGQSAPALSFRQDFDKHFTDTAQVDLSVDGGQTWETVLDQTAEALGPRQETIPIPQAAHKPDVRVRFHYIGTWDDWWQVDDVVLGKRLCVPTAGGLVLGHVRDRNTGSAIDAAEVRLGEQAVRTSDGFYWLFAPGSSAALSASAPSYTTQPRTTSVARGGIRTVEFSLAAGRLSVEPGELSLAARGTREVRRSFTITNTGTAPVAVELSERKAVGPVANGAGAKVVEIPGTYSPLPFAKAPLTNGTSPKPAAAPWTDVADYPIRIMDNAVGELDGKIYSVGGVDGVEVSDRGFVYDPDKSSWSPIAPLPSARENAAGAFIGDTFFVNGGWGPDLRATKTTFAYTPARNTWRKVADAPIATAGAGRAVLDGKLYVIGGCTNACDGQDVQVYDPATDSWQLVASYPMSAGHLACAALDDSLYCAGGVRRGGTTWQNTYAYSPAADTWTPRADLPIPLWGMGYTAAYDQLIVSGGINGGVLTNASYAYDPRTDAWSVLPAANKPLYRGGSTCGFYRVGGSPTSGFQPVSDVQVLPTYGDCEPVDVPWLALDRTTFTLAAGEKARVTVTAKAPAPGTYEAGVWIREDTPYLAQPLDVTLAATR